MPLESRVEICNACGDVVPDRAHAFDAIDAASGSLVGVPALESGARDRVDVRFSSQREDDVDIAYQLRVNEFGLFVGGIDADLCERLAPDRSLMASPGLVPAE
jgi:hypothetical protein